MEEQEEYSVLHARDEIDGRQMEIWRVKRIRNGVGIVVALVYTDAASKRRHVGVTRWWQVQGRPLVAHWPADGDGQEEAA